ncbi:HlyC/CorC family transporter [bacterium]|nr:MAG: HlyC/CorC family transporter [bacterium]
MQALLTVLLLLGSAFFVSAEYALVSSRRGRIETLARKGNRTAKLLLPELDDLAPYVAGLQIGVTIVGIGMGSLAEPYITESLASLMPWAPKWAQTAVSLFVVVFSLLVIGELCPKYVALRFPERISLLYFRPLQIFTFVLRPLIILARWMAERLLRLVGIRLDHDGGDVMPKEELLMLVQAGGTEGVLDKAHADLVTRALRLDVLAARDIMIHRVDIEWVDVSLDRDGLLDALGAANHTRLPVCRGDIDDIIGVVYLQDVIRAIRNPNFSLEALVRPTVAVPENLTMERIVSTMREQKTQLLIVMDEYGGTSGLVTLEDVVEEVFGELEDRLESERPALEELPNGRISARADLRLDEVVSRLRLNVADADRTDTLATVVVNGLEGIPRPGDIVQTEIGTIRVENMARRRITRVGLQIDERTLPDHEAR